MTKAHSKNIIILILLTTAISFNGPAPAAESFADDLQENEAAGTRSENYAKEQQEIELRWEIFNEQHKPLSPKDQEKINIMRRERERRWDRSSALEKPGMNENPETCISVRPFQECNI